MLAIVRIALRRPYTFIVVGLLILLIGTARPRSCAMPVDIFPSIDIPIIGVAWQYQGPAARSDGRPASSLPFLERSLTTTVNDIEHHRNRTPTPPSAS